MFSKIVKHAMLDENVTQADLASRIGITQQNIQSKLSQDNMREKSMQEIADALDLELIIKLRHKTPSL
ncbi:helix-turn-helix domain-containing protein [Eubacterium aggregans]|uniref:helix-turn-helix domain-containing protein n=1 Tax=Eubacterium aggregans TaxID=81409 RepID=UPI003F378E0A